MLHQIGLTLRATLQLAPLEARLRPSALAAINLPPLFLLPHAFRNLDHGATLARQLSGVAARNRLEAAHRVALGPGVRLRRAVLAVRHVDDPARVCRRARWRRRDAEVRLAVVHKLKVTAGPHDALAVALHPLKQIAARARRLHAELLELRRGHGEERLPGGELARVPAQAAADELEERLGIGDKRPGAGDRGRRSCFVQASYLAAEYTGRRR